MIIYHRPTLTLKTKTGFTSLNIWISQKPFGEKSSRQTRQRLSYLSTMMWRWGFKLKNTVLHCTIVSSMVGLPLSWSYFVASDTGILQKSERNNEGLFANSWPSRRHRCVLQIDSDSMLFLKWIKQDNIMFLVWCSQSTNLKSIEHLWTMLESWVYARKQSNSNCFPCEEKRTFFTQ